MATVTCARLVSSANSYALTTGFLADLAGARALSESGYVITASGAVKAVAVSSRGTWLLTSTLPDGMPLTPAAFASLRGTGAIAPGHRALVAVAATDGSHAAIVVEAGPSDPVEP